MKRIEYQLNIFSPGSRNDLLAGWSADTPYMAFARGDLINCKGFEASADGRSRVLRVDAVEHVMWEAPDRFTHKISVFTSLA